MTTEMITCEDAWGDSETCIYKAFVSGYLEKVLESDVSDEITNYEL